jgi:hypothetical protein
MKKLILFIAIFALVSYNVKAQTQPVSLCGNYAVDGNFQIGNPVTDVPGYGKKLFFGTHTLNGGSFTDNGDELYIARYNYEWDRSDLRINVGNDYNDKFVVGRKFWDQPDFEPFFTVGMNGKIGINNYNPSRTLDVNGDVKINGNQYIPSDKALILGSETDANKQLKLHFIGGSSGGTGDSYVDYGGNIFFRCLSYSTTPIFSFIRGNNNSKTIIIGSPTNINKRMKFTFVERDTNGDSYLDFGACLYVRANSESKPVAMFSSSGLTVKGTVTTNQLKIVTTNFWPDFVFSKDYKLPSLHEVKHHIQENNHLPGIPTETEVKENGIEVGEMQAKLLQKIEELTLYVIQQQETIDELKTEMNLLKNGKE